MWIENISVFDEPGATLKITFCSLPLNTSSRYWQMYDKCQLPKNFCPCSKLNQMRIIFSNEYSLISLTARFCAAVKSSQISIISSPECQLPPLLLPPPLQRQRWRLCYSQW